MINSHKVIEGSSKASDKMEIIVNLIETARTRTRLTLNMIYEEDVFAKDDINLKLDIYASRFAASRKQLLEMELDQYEKEIIQKQNAVIRPALTWQRQAAELAVSDNPEDNIKARDILMKNVYPEQGKIIDYFMQLLNYQKSLIDKSRQQANIDFNHAMQSHFTLFVVTFLLAILVAIYVIQRSRNSEKELFLEKERAQITLKSIGDAVITTDRLGRVEYINPVAEMLIGKIASDVAGKHIARMFRAYDEVNQNWMSDSILQLLDHEHYHMPSSDILLHRDDEESIHISINIAPIQDQSHRVLGTITTFRDITRERTMAKHIEHQAHHDALTGLLNRREFETKVGQGLELYSEDTSHALCVMDLDRFKIVNDTVGHTAGDELLKQISTRIKQQLRKSDLVARIGGDEFALFLINVKTIDAQRITEGVLKEIREFQFIWGGQAFRVGASIGLVDAPPQVSTYETLYHAADTACYMAKHGGRDRVHVVSFDDKGLLEKREETQWVNNINEALDENRFTLYAQAINPIGRDPSLQPHMEVLIRMMDKSGEVVPPMAFIPSAERYNLMPKIDEWVVNQVVNLIVQSQANANMVYAINLSGQSMADDIFIESVLETLRSSKVDTSRLCFEITETSAVSNMENATRFLSELQKMGCTTALDDFGSGLSSFAYLRTFPIDYLKIDGLFVKQIVDDPTSRVMVEAIHSIGRTMNLKTIAEFVENEAILEQLKQMGIDYAQGYYYGAPDELKYD